jgi:hypothetical protein
MIRVDIVSRSAKYSVLHCSNGNIPRPQDTHGRALRQNLVKPFAKQCEKSPKSPFPDPSAAHQRGKREESRFSLDCAASFPAISASSMTNVAIDSSVFRSQAISSVYFSLLRQLVGEGQLAVFVSEMVARECASGRREKQFEALRMAKRGLKDVCRSDLSSKSSERYKSANEQIAALLDQSGKEAEDAFFALLKSFDAEVIPIAESHAKAAFDGYFAGAAPYNSVKNRNDIPDAFILEAVRECARERQAEQESLYFLVADGALQKAARSIDGVTVLPDFKAFFTSDELRPLVANAAIEEAWPRILPLLKSWKGEVHAALAKELEVLLKGQDVVEHYEDAVDYRAWIVGIDDFPDLDANLDYATYLGEDIVEIDFTSWVSVTVNYHVFNRGHDDSNDDFVLESDSSHFALDGHFTLKLSFRDRSKLQPEFDPAKEITGFKLEVQHYSIR